MMINEKWLWFSKLRTITEYHNLKSIISYQSQSNLGPRHLYQGWMFLQNLSTASYWRPNYPNINFSFVAIDHQLRCKQVYVPLYSLAIRHKTMFINAHNFSEHWPETWKNVMITFRSCCHPMYVIENVNYVKHGKSINNNIKQ